jgi:hypothetical protein
MFDFETFLTDHWSNADNLHSFLKTYGQSYQRATLYKWFLRGAIPAEGFAILLTLLEIDSGKPISLVKYLKEPS